MVITLAKEYDEIKKQLEKNDKIWVMSCNSCVRVIGTGGEDKMIQLADRLKKDGFQVVGTSLYGTACIKEIVKEKIDPDTIVMLACDAGVYNIDHILKPNKMVKALSTLGIGVRDLKGNYTLVKKFK